MSKFRSALQRLYVRDWESEYIPYNQLIRTLKRYSYCYTALLVRASLNLDDAGRATPDPELKQQTEELRERFWTSLDDSIRTADRHFQRKMVALTDKGEVVAAAARRHTEALAEATRNTGDYADSDGGGSTSGEGSVASGVGAPLRDGQGAVDSQHSQQQFRGGSNASSTSPLVTSSPHAMSQHSNDVQPYVHAHHVPGLHSVANDLPWEELMLAYAEARTVKAFASLNRILCERLLRKHDKLTGLDAGRNYELAERAKFCRPTELRALLDRAVTEFAGAMTGGDKEQARRRLNEAVHGIQQTEQERDAAKKRAYSADDDDEEEEDEMQERDVTDTTSMKQRQRRVFDEITHRQQAIPSVLQCTDDAMIRQAAGLVRSRSNFIIDMDGVIYHDRRLLPGVRTLVRWLNATRKRYLFLTNGSSRTPMELSQKLARMGVPDIDPKHFHTAALATARFCRSQTPTAGSCYVIGGTGLVAAMYDEGFVMNSVNPDYVVIGEGEDYTYSKLSTAINLVRRGARLIGACPDLVDKVETEYAPSTGALILPIVKATGATPYFCGKPNPLFIRAGLERLGNVDADSTVLIGDRCDTDILGGLEAGIMTCLVLSGVTERSDLPKYAYRPHVIVSSVADIVRV